LSRIYLVRHGQAGTRAKYDSLSELGRKQARLLGEFWAAQRIEFTAAFTGTLARQEQTAQDTAAAYAASGRAFPAIVRDCGWNEFDLADVYRALAPQLCAEDAEFRCEYEEMERQARANADEPGAAVHRRWMRCDRQLVSAWISGRYCYEGESWPAFCERVLECRMRLEQFGRDDNIAVFTSATPIGIWTEKTFDIEDARAMRLAGVLLNSSVTMLRMSAGELRLHSFNVVSHLSDPELHSYR
jgi:broad specificity phosphatase PhoE